MHDHVIRFQPGLVHFLAGHDAPGRDGNCASRADRSEGGIPARCLSNALTQWAEDVAPADIPSYPCAYNLIKALTIAAKAKGATAYAAQWAGAQAARARALPARELVEALDKEMKDILVS
ncbi:hypothetical protein [Paracoccus actinidiae]|uniref:hypothetical protein n=1 Tax=Paracoccus actinidiae TaxID=3064531 RepID=UPI0027D34B34|nr:hypothetical protein [Paracoccus sp. M09]